MNLEDLNAELIELGVVSAETKGAWISDQDTEGGRMFHPGLATE